MPNLLRFLLLIVMCIAPTFASAEILITCKNAKGTITIIGDGWHDDGFTGGVTQLVRDGDKYDLIITDAAGTRSAKSDGAIIIPAQSNDEAMVFIAAYPLATELYLFDFLKGVMIFSSFKISVGPKRGGLYRANCE